MLRSLCLPLVGLALFAATAVAQTTPTTRKTTAKTKVTTARKAPNATPTTRRASTNDVGAGESGYAAPGEPIQMPGSGGKNTANYDGQPAHPVKNSTLTTPK